MLCLLVSLIILELFCRSFMFYHNLRLSYQFNKGYYNFQGSFWEYAKEYRDFKKIHRADERLIVTDIFNRKFYIPNVDIRLGQLKIKTNSFGMLERDISLEKRSNTYWIIYL